MKAVDELHSFFFWKKRCPVMTDPLCGMILTGMTDRNGRGKGGNVRHRCDDGQKWPGKRKKCPS